MKVKISLVISLLVLSMSIAYIITLLNQDFVLSKETKFEATLNVWTTTPELSELFNEFQDQTNIKMNVKQFQSPELLMEELELTKLNNNVPEVVEVSSSFGIDKMREEYDIQSIDGLVDTHYFHKAAKQLLSSEDNLYAYPLGLEVPVFYFNKTLLSDESGQKAYPFKDEEVLKEYKVYQDKKNNGATKRPFWFFHFDENIEWYRDAYVSASESNSASQFDQYVEMLQNEYELIPLFDSPMAISRFVSFEIGTLTTSSKHIQTIQQLIGNRFEFEVHPFIENRNDNVLVAGKGLAVMKLPETDNDNLRLLFDYLNSEETQVQLLGATGMLPSLNRLVDNEKFVQGLPMGKYLMPLAKFNANFTGINDAKAVEGES